MGEENIEYLRNEWSNIHIELQLCMIDSVIDLNDLEKKL